MDGFKSKINHSIQFRLSFWIAIIIIAMAIFSVIISYFSALHEAKEIQDAGLKQIGLLALNNKSSPLKNNEATKHPQVIIQYSPTLNQASELASATYLNLPNHLSDGFHTLMINKDRYRVLKLTINNQKVAIAERTILLDEAALSGAISTALPMLLLLPILIVVAHLLIRHAFLPTIRLSEEIQNRSALDLTPLSQKDIPIEIGPFISSINQLFAKVNQSIESQNQFIADAAHELRSPFTALSLQTERLSNAEMSVTATEYLAQLKLGITRASALMEQLLSFAKTQRVSNLEKTDLSVNQIIINLLEDMIPLAEVKRLNVGIKSNQDVRIRMNEADLICIIKNLLDNAIRYTPNGGQIDLSIIKESNHILFEIEDNGQGIPDTEKKRVFDRFHRVLGNNAQGSGLGLSIVQTIINRIKGEIILLDSDNFTSGLKIKVYLPLEITS